MTNFDDLLSNRQHDMHRFRRFWDPYPPNVERVLNCIAPADTVLDAGGWYKPFNRANFVVDLHPYETRGQGGSIGGGPEQFSSATWVQMDICDARLPFQDKEIDFIYCGQVLEDTRDPLFVCRELVRVGKAGCIEMPSIWVECQYGVDAEPYSNLYPGFHKHRWLVEIKGNKLTFIPKLVLLSAFRFVDEAVAERYLQCHAIWSTSFLWHGSFEFEELPYPDAYSLLDRLKRYFDEFDYSRFDRCG
ncbi:MAG: class I SAM-dependent methyltransferase [Ardenticatenaceae bacterium]|nr:class I SAM-dependent methyltransferase [Ardenticatenaceae bacterium]